MPDTNIENTWVYDASQIKVLEWLEPVRQRPGMYIWSTDSRGLHHLIYEIVDNAVDEALAGYCKHISIVLHSDNSVTVYDDGRGIPVDKHPKTGKSALETVFTVLHAGGKFEKSAYKISGWLHGVGASVVNALSQKLIAHVHRNGKIREQVYHIGVPQEDVKEIGDSIYNGTTVSFRPDKTIFETTKFSYSIASTRLKYAAYLTPGVTFTILDEITHQTERYYFEWGIKTWLKNLVWEQKTLGQIITFTQEGNDIMCEIALQFVNTNNDNILSFVNNINTIDGWTHVIWFKNALLRVINEIMKNQNLADGKIWEIQLSDITDWLYGIISIKIPEPQFEWQTKGKLGNAYVRKEVEWLVYNYLVKYFLENEYDFLAIFEKIKLSAKARIAAKLARETVLRKNAILSTVLPGKLADCSAKSKENTELYIVEGNSAWWSAKQWRDSSFQAILPLKGKILNTEQAMIDKIMSNEEVKSLIMAIWAGIKDSFDASRIRYDRIIIMTDADVDGAHIRTLLLTFFFRYMRPLIDNGNLYIAMPPLYKLKQAKKEQYIYPPIDNLDQAILENGFELDKVEIQRYKGLGEMNPEQLRETTMDPQTRKMQQVSIQDAEGADALFRILMWNDVAPRKHFILTHAKNVKELDI
jgi:DNA gyrase subunit B